MNSALNLMLSKQSESTFFLHSNPTVRFIEFLDFGKPKRRQWLNHILFLEEVIQLTEFDLTGISQQLQSFDILFCGVDDIEMLGAAFCYPADMIIKNKVSFAFCAEPTPLKKVILLNHGFDDVFHIEMEPVEIFTRIVSVTERTEIYNPKPIQEAELEWDRVKVYGLSSKLTLAEEKIVQALIVASGCPLKYETLARHAGIESSDCRSSLKVLISKIRKKLVGMEIHSYRKYGYSIKICQ